LLFKESCITSGNLVGFYSVAKACNLYEESSIFIGFKVLPGKVGEPPPN